MKNAKLYREIARALAEVSYRIYIADLFGACKLYWNANLHRWTSLPSHATPYSFVGGEAVIRSAGKYFGEHMHLEEVD